MENVKEGMKTFRDVTTVLFQAHSLATILQKRALYPEEEPVVTNTYSDETLSVTEILVEKIEYCLNAIVKAEEQSLRLIVESNNGLLYRQQGIKGVGIK